MFFSEESTLFANVDRDEVRDPNLSLGRTQNWQERRHSSWALVGRAHEHRPARGNATRYGQRYSNISLFSASLTKSLSATGTNLLDNAPYMFEGNPLPGPRPPPAAPQPQTTSLQPIQSPLPTAVSHVFPDLQPPDQNNVYDQLRYYESASYKVHRYLHSSCSRSNSTLRPVHRLPCEPQSVATRRPPTQRSRPRFNIAADVAAHRLTSA